MSSRRWGSVSSTLLTAAVVLIGLGSATPAKAQDIASIEARVARLQERARALEAKADSIAAANRRRFAGTLDSVEVGSFKVLADTAMMKDVRRAATLAWTALTGVFGDSASMLLHDRTFVAITDAIVDSAHTDLRWHATLGTPVLAPREDRVRGLAMNLVSAAYESFWQRLDPAMKDWISSPLLPTLEPGKIPGNSYVEVVTAGSPIARECFSGTLSACRRSLGFDRPADPAAAWYSAAERRALVDRLSFSLRSGTDRDAHARCLHMGSDSACSALLAANAELVPAILSGMTRGTFLVTALRKGGSGALSRLLESSGDSVSTRIERVAGTRLDVVLAEWRASIIAARPVKTRLAASSALTSMFWMACLLTLALRSSRWR